MSAPDFSHPVQPQPRTVPNSSRPIAGARGLTPTERPPWPCGAFVPLRNVQLIVASCHSEAQSVKSVTLMRPAVMPKVRSLIEHISTLAGEPHRTSRSVDRTNDPTYHMTHDGAASPEIEQLTLTACRGQPLSRGLQEALDTASGHRDGDHLPHPLVAGRSSGRRSLAIPPARLLPSHDGPLRRARSRSPGLPRRRRAPGGRP